MLRWQMMREIGSSLCARSVHNAYQLVHLTFVFLLSSVVYLTILSSWRRCVFALIASVPELVIDVPPPLDFH